MQKTGTKISKGLITDTAKEVTGKVLSESTEAVKGAAKATKKKVKQVSKTAKGAAKTAAKETAGVVTTAVKKTVIKKDKINKKLYIQYMGKEFSEDDIYEMFIKEWTKEYKIPEIKDLKIYFKLEDETAYCVVNGNITIDIKL